MPVILLALFSNLFITSCSVDDNPQPIKLGQDDCTACKMTLMDGQYACEFITDKGKCYKLTTCHVFLTTWQKMILPMKMY